jgi:hypothetical protein
VKAWVWDRPARDPEDPLLPLERSAGIWRAHQHAGPNALRARHGRKVVYFGSVPDGR